MNYKVVHGPMHKVRIAANREHAGHESSLIERTCSVRAES